MLNWIVNNKNIVLTSSNSSFAANIKAVIGVGDCVNSTDRANEYKNAETAWTILDANRVAFTTAPGNHDYSGGLSFRDHLGAQFATGYFSATNRSSVYGSGIPLGSGDIAYWAGSYVATGANTAVKFVISGIKLLVLASNGTQFQRTDTYGPNAYGMPGPPYSNCAAEAWSSLGINTGPTLFGISFTGLQRTNRDTVQGNRVSRA
jgi:hypothetical protein